MSASSYRVARRIVNSLRAGHAVRGYEGLAGSQLVLIAVPEPRLAATLAGMIQAPVNWLGMAVVLCDSNQDSAGLEMFAARGASVATLNVVQGFDERCFVTEGDRTAVRLLCHLIRDGRTQVVEILSSKKALYSAGVSFATSLCAPLIEASLECLRGAGLPPAAAVPIAGRIFDKTLRAYLKAGKKSWHGPLASGDFAEIRRQLQLVSALDPHLGQYFLAGALLACERFSGKAQRSVGLASMAGTASAPLSKALARAAGDRSTFSA